MFSSRADRLTRFLSEFDKDLFVERDDEGRFHVKQKHRGPFGELTSKPANYVCSLTDTWNFRGVPVDWGVEPLKARLKAHRLASDGGQEFLKELEIERERTDASKERDFKNSVESFLYEFKPQFAKATNDVNTSTLEKTDKRRLKDGFSQSR